MERLRDRQKRTECEEKTHMKNKENSYLFIVYSQVPKKKSWGITLTPNSNSCFTPLIFIAKQRAINICLIRLTATSNLEGACHFRDLYYLRSDSQMRTKLKSISLWHHLPQTDAPSLKLCTCFCNVTTSSFSVKFARFCELGSSIPAVNNDNEDVNNDNSWISIPL